jgi:membrane protein implicated in regulation of membrane protease activity
MDAWVIWLIVAVVFAVAEVINLSFYLFPFAIGAAGAALVDLADDAVGKVRIDGEVWTARTYDDDHVIEAGTRVHVMEIKGATALVSD